MGAQGSRGAVGGAPSPDEPAGFITVSESVSRAETVDPDLEMLRRLPPVAPLIPLPTMRGLFAAAGGASGASAMDELNRLRADCVVDICHSYVGLSHQAIVPLCEGQKALARKMSGVEALCRRLQGVRGDLWTKPFATGCSDTSKTPTQSPRRRVS